MFNDTFHLFGKHKIIETVMTQFYFEIMLYVAINLFCKEHSQKNVAMEQQYLIHKQYNWHHSWLVACFAPNCLISCVSLHAAAYQVCVHKIS